MLLPGVLVLAVGGFAAPGATVTPFRTGVAPRVDPVFGDVNALRAAVDRFLVLQSQMEQIRGEFSTAVHTTLSQLTPPTGKPAEKCPGAALSHYGKALVAGGKFLALGRQLEDRFRDIRRSDDLGESAGLTPDYRVKIKRARDLYLELLRDYREMRVAFYDQLGAEMHHARCQLPTPPTRPGQNAAPLAPDPNDPAAWEIEPALEEPPVTTETTQSKTPNANAVAPAVWITIDNSRCSEQSQLSIDGTPLGAVAGHKKVTVRTKVGPHELCVLPSSDKRACGTPGTVRRAYLYEGWTLVVRCGK